MIFVFGSNLAGIHGAGAAIVAARQHGALRGRGVGLHGNSYAIPTKDENIKTLPLATVEAYINQFIHFAEAFAEVEFKVTCIGCGLAGFRDVVIAPIFLKAPANCHFDTKWRPIFEYYDRETKYWGTY